MRQKAMEKLSETSKRKGKEENEPVKKKRRSAFNTLQYLKGKAEREKGVKEKELQMRKEDKEVQMQFFTAVRYLKNVARRPTTIKGSPAATKRKSATTNDPANGYDATTARAK
jgi:hypothetical protein